MKIFLAGCEDIPFLKLTEVVGHKTVLFSYFHWKALGDKAKNEFIEFFQKNDDYEVICDSGLFTLMFGVGKGGNYDINYMREYTKEYIDTVKQFKIKNLTIVESDVHKLLGMDAVFELRKYFENSGYKTLYVWHYEEGIDGLIKLADRYNYIAISVPELRILCKGKINYQHAVKDLEFRVRTQSSNNPKIHLLGNTVQNLMETNVSYSCDSTSWLSGGRWGTYVSFKNNKLVAEKITGNDFAREKQALIDYYPEHFKELFDFYAHRSEKYLDYIITMYMSAKNFKIYQDHLNTKYQFIGDRNE